MPTGDQNADPFIGQIVDGRYTIRSLLGRGGMGSVYRAWQKNLNREVALKILVREEKGKRLEEIRDRFTLEAATAAKLKHPHTITVFDFGVCEVLDQPLYYISMELLEGRSLSRVLGRKGRFSVARAVNIGRQIAASLQEAHGLGVVHRDMKPGNVMLLSHAANSSWQDDFVKVLDFGLAKTFGQDNLPQLTRAGTFLGSPRYVAPEQINGQVADGRTDIYALGCLLVRMLSGAVPFDGETHVEVLKKHLNEPVPDLQHQPWPDELKGLIAASLAKEADERPSQMAEVIEVLNQIQKVLAANADSSKEAIGTQNSGLDTSAPEPISSKSSSGRSFEQSVNLSLAEELSVDGGATTSQAGEPYVLSHAAPKSGISQSSIWPTVGLLGLVLGGAIWALVQVNAFGLLPFGEAVSEQENSIASSQELAAVKIRIISSPPSSVFRIGKDKEEPDTLLGITPVEVNWRLVEGELVRLRYERQGYGIAYAEARVPESGAQVPYTMEIEAILQPIK